ncbi:hypothetical protein ACPPVU_02695 [Mucilaginibacter sp. McL0603]|uniref:hypothetical protein n=1 Tax=Mucilaginibacter sp. McL0603 TaxID=3415670 RepID=UPI003CEB5A1F
MKTLLTLKMVFTFNKKVTLTLVIFFFFNSFLSAQSFKKMNLPQFKESPKIDSLFDIIIPKSDSNYVYYSVRLLNNHSNLELTVSQLINKGADIYYTFMLHEDMKYFGYFQYKNKFILMNSDTKKNGLFKVLSDLKPFVFILHNPEVYDNHPDLYFNIYYYEGGKFLPTGPKILDSFKRIQNSKDSLKKY